MWVTMSVMLSSDVRTRVGPNTRAKFLGSIWGTKTRDVSRGKILGNTLVFCAQGDLILLRVVCHFLQVANQELQCVEIVIWKVVKL